MLCTFGLLNILLDSPSQHDKTGKQLLCSLFFVSNQCAPNLSGNYFSPTPNPFLHTWSLSVEMQFYLMLPLILLLVSHLGNHRRYVIMILTSVFMLSATLWFFSESNLFFVSKLGFENSIDFQHYSLLGRIWQFLIGGAAGLIAKRLNSRNRQTLIFNVALAILISSLLVPITLDRQTMTLLVTVLSMFLVYVSNSVSHPSLFFQVIKWIGDRSYSIYLIHYPLIYLSKYSPIFQVS